MENIAIKLIYFFMDGCGWCERFLPQWNIIKEKIDSNDLKNIKAYQFERSELKSNERALKIQNHVEVNGFPTIVVKINDEYYKYEGNRTISDILKFIKSKLTENNLLNQDLIQYFDEKIKQYQLEFPNQTGGNANYKKKYHKYKDMYNSLLKKYNKIK
jgi:hypothetical protein